MNLATFTMAEVTMTATAPLRHRCPFVDEEDNGTITITWDTYGGTIELHALRTYLDEYAEVEISHEELTERIKHDLATLPGIKNVKAFTTWDTAGMEVAVTSG